MSYRRHLSATSGESGYTIISRTRREDTCKDRLVDFFYGDVPDIYELCSDYSLPEILIELNARFAENRRRVGHHPDNPLLLVYASTSWWRKTKLHTHLSAIPTLEDSALYAELQSLMTQFMRPQMVSRSDNRKYPVA